MRHDPLYIPEGPVDDAPARTRAVDEVRDAERRADAAADEAFATRETAAKLRDAAARSLADYLVDLAGLTAEYATRRAAWSEADEAFATRETAAKLRDAAARSLAGHLVDHLADLAGLTAEYATRRAAWSEADEEYNRAFKGWLRAYDQRKRLEDADTEGGRDGA